MKEKKSRSRGSTLFSAICWTLTTVLWAVSITINVSGQYYTGLLLLQIAVLLLSLLNTIINWLRYANFNQKHLTNNITGGTTR